LSARPPVTGYGDSALVVGVDGVAAARRIADAIDGARDAPEAPVGIEDVVVGFASVVVHLDPTSAQPDQCERWLADLAADALAATDMSAGPDGGGRTIELPVTFDGPDLDAVADSLGRSPRQVVDLLTGAPLQVAFLGFAPGFPYLVGLPPELASISRRSTPRTAVPPGSVAVAGGFAAVYPQSTPGGWMLLGRTATRLFDPDTPPYAHLRAGDTVRFSDLATTPGRNSRATPVPARTRTPLQAHGPRSVGVLDPGMFTTVQDSGRRRVAPLGVPRAGPCDPDAMRLANRLVGNPDNAGAIECTAVGPVLRFTVRGHLAVVGPSAGAIDVHVDGHQVGTEVVVPIAPGQVVSIGRVRSGLRAYAGISGGIETPLAVGSRSSDQLCGLGPGPLIIGDQLTLGAATQPHGMLIPIAEIPGSGHPIALRVIAGPHNFPPAALGNLVGGSWRVGAASNRIGIRLAAGGRRLGSGTVDLPSTGMITGAIQVPPDGNPIILMPDHATVGGYPIIACVITADQPVLGQLQPGTP
jgi:KipI family sensor histidine kinase inhibitor